MSTPGAAGRSQTAPGALRSAAATVLRFDLSQVSLTGALRATTGCVLVLVVALVVVGKGGAAAATVGALLAAIPSLSTGARRPLATMAATTAGVALSTFVGSVTAHDAALHLLILAPWGFAGGMLVALGDTGSVVGTQATMAFVVFGRFAEPPAGAGKLAGYIAAGGAVQILLAVATRWPVALRTQRRGLADAYRDLSELALGNPLDSSLPAGRALDAAEAALSSPALLRRPDVSILRSLVDEGRRVRVELSALQALRVQLDRVAEGARGALTAAVDRALAQVASALASTADVVAARGDVTASSLDLALEEVSAAAAAAVAAGSGEASVTRSVPSGGPAVAVALSHHLTALGGQLRAAAMLAAEAGGSGSAPAASVRARLPRGLLERLDGQAQVLLANLSPRSAALRHAVRLALVVPLADLLAAHTPLQRGYWVPLTAALVLRPDFGTTFSRGFARLAGTVAGVGITGVIVASGHLGGATTVAILGVLAFGAFASFRASYAAYSAFLTGLVVLLVNLATPGAHATLATALDRLLDTLVGGALALLVYVAWPTWTTDEARRALAGVAEKERSYLSAVLGAVAGTAPLGEAEARALARQLRLARSNCEATITRSMAEPYAYQLDSRMAAGVLAGIRRLSLTTHVLRTGLASGPVAKPVPEVEPLRRALDDALARLATAVLAGTAPTLPPLRELHSTLARQVSGRPDAALIVVETDELVDAADTIGALLGARIDQLG